MTNRTVLVASITMMVLIAGVAAAFEIHKTANIVIDEEIIVVEFWGFKVKDALTAADIKIHDGDIILPGLEETISDNQNIVILPAAWISITADGRTHNLWTAERVPERLLNQISIPLNPGDQVWANGVPIDPSSSLPTGYNPSLQIQRQTSIYLDISGENQILQSNAFTLGEALSEANIQIHSRDRLDPPANTILNGKDIHAILERSMEVTIETLDKEFQTRVLATTVGEALTEAGFPLQGLDYSIPGENDSLPGDGRIRVVRVREEIQIGQEPIPFDTQFQPSEQIELDNQGVIQVGEYGILAKKLRIVYEDNQEISRSIEEEWIAKVPKPRIIGYGTKVTIGSVNTPNGSIQYWRAVDAYATSYSPCRIGLQNQCSNRTASGAELKKGVIGVIRSWYNVMQGQSVYIPGYGFATIEDIGGGFPDRHWVDLGYSDDDWVRWSGYVTVYFLLPVPANILYILD